MFGTMLFTPSELDGNNDANTLGSVDVPSATIVLDTTADEDAMLMLHIYNFDTGEEASMPDAAMEQPAVPSALVLLGLLAMVSGGALAIRTGLNR